jgi:hypothetical protein
LLVADQQKKTFRQQSTAHPECRRSTKLPNADAQWASTQRPICAAPMPNQKRRMLIVGSQGPTAVISPRSGGPSPARHPASAGPLVRRGTRPFRPEGGCGSDWRHHLRLEDRSRVLRRNALDVGRPRGPAARAGRALRAIFPRGALTRCAQSVTWRACHGSRLTSARATCCAATWIASSSYVARLVAG